MFDFLGLGRIHSSVSPNVMVFELFDKFELADNVRRILSMEQDTTDESEIPVASLASGDARVQKID